MSSNTVRRRLLGYLAAGALVAGTAVALAAPAAATNTAPPTNLSVQPQGGASDDHVPTCVKADQAEYTYSLKGNTATVKLKQGQQLCRGEKLVFSLVSYKTSGMNGKFPQTRYDMVSGTLDRQHDSIELCVKLPPCYWQVDLIKGTDAPQQLTEAYFGPHGTLLKGEYGGRKKCECPSPSPSASSSSPSPSPSESESSSPSSSPTPSGSSSASPSPSSSQTAGAPVSTSPASGTGGSGSGSLPVTGSGMLVPLVVSAIVLIVVGAVLSFVAYRRRRTATVQH